MIWTFSGLSLVAACSDDSGEALATPLIQAAAPGADDRSELVATDEVAATDQANAAYVQEPDDAGVPSSSDAELPPTPDAETPTAPDAALTPPDAQVTSPDAQATPPDAQVTPEDAAVSDPCPLWYADCDGDGYAAPTAPTVRSCDTPALSAGCAGWTKREPAWGAIDCEDTSADHHPGANLGLAIPVPSTSGGLASLLCRPDGTYASNPSLRCVVTNNPDLNCDGRLEPDPKGATFCVSGGHCIASLTHECSDENDCSCWSGATPPCGVVYNTSAHLCGGGSGSFIGDTALLCR